MICHVLKFPKGGLGACTGIIPKERYKCYQDFHDKKEQKEGKKRRMDKLMTVLTNQQDATAAMLTSSCEK